MLAKDKIKLICKLNGLTDLELLKLHNRYVKVTKQNELTLHEQEKNVEVIKYKKLMKMQRNEHKAREILEKEFDKRGGFKIVYDRVKKETLQRKENK